MKRDWRDVLRGVTLHELEAHPARYRKEPYRTAIKEMMEDLAKLTAAFQPIADTIKRNEVFLREWVDDPVFAEIAVADIARRLNADASIRGRALARKNTGKRTSKYASEYPAWERVAREELSANPRRSVTKLVTAIINKTQTNADRRVVKGWIEGNRRKLIARN